MSRYHSYINSTTALLEAYNGSEPFASFLKKYFAAHKKFGSKDRKQVSHLCYCYFRLGDALPGMPVAEKLLAGLLLCSHTGNETLHALKPEWAEWVSRPSDEKIRLAELPVSSAAIFPWQDELSADIDKEKFSFSHLHQPDLFLRLRPGKEGVVKQKLADAGILFEEPLPGCLTLANSVKADSLLELDKEAVVQDLNSQRVGEFLQGLKPQTSPGKPSVWDCCAASGGKSILAKDILGTIDLTVSDIRQSIIANLQKRFERAGIEGYTHFVADLAKGERIGSTKYDIVIADAPCSGSGTWGRTPEQLYYFDGAEIDRYSLLQRRIMTQVVTAIHPGGHFLYITCSVFEKENEAQVAWLEEKFHLRTTKMEYLKGYDKKADTLFAALLQKPL